MESKANSEKFYITSAINYTNATPHIGHAYEAILCDVISRYFRIYGSNVFFLTGTDEHGQKIADTAQSKNMTPKELCDTCVVQFKELNNLLNISNNAFLRTTDEFHKEHARKLWTMCEEKEDIYLGVYTGWYNVREEAFVTELVASQTDYKDPISGVPYQKMEEESFFFRMSKYQTQLIEHINSNPQFIVPTERKNEILSRLKEPLEDLSISRTTFNWGVEIEGTKHIMYVWFDALSNYLSGIRYFEHDSPNKCFWPPDCQVIGKDILWFHSVIWPCMLLSAGLPLPKSIVAHGFVNAADGRKMSKSFDNVVNPFEVLKKLKSSDIFRYLLLKTSEIGRDLRLDISMMWSFNDSDLADTIGNLVHRDWACARIPVIMVDETDVPFDAIYLSKSVHEAASNYKFQWRLQAVLELIMNAWRRTNRYLTEKAPWKIADMDIKQKSCRTIIEAIYLLAHFSEPFIPEGAKKITEYLNTPFMTLRTLNPNFDNLVPNTKLTMGEVLYVKSDKY